MIFHFFSKINYLKNYVASDDFFKKIIFFKQNEKKKIENRITNFIFIFFISIILFYF
jgi:hypothetical protein